MLYQKVLTAIAMGFVLTQTTTSIGTPSVGLNDMLFVFFESPTVYSKHNFEQTGEVFANPKYNINLPNAFYVPGYLDSPFSPSSQLIIDAYFKLGGHNVFSLDWTSLSSGTYANAVLNANVVGTRLGEIYLLLFANGVTPTNSEVVGHGIGAHLVGQIGRSIIAKSNGAYKLPRITGLDPAAYLYYPPIAGVQHINRNDATYVDIIHTDAGGYGTSRLTGTADYFVNTGRRFQPGCLPGVFLIRSDNDLCSHRRAIQLWAESVSTPSSTFTATRLGNPNVSSQMGYKSSNMTTRGKYIVFTNSATPFSIS